MINKPIRFPNLAHYERTEVVYTTVPFAKGEWDGLSSLVLTTLVLVGLMDLFAMRVVLRD